MRGLTLVGNRIGGNNNGVNFVTGRALNIQNCKIGGFGDFGIKATYAGAAISVSDTIVSGNTFGIDIGPQGSGTFTAVFKRVEVSGNDGPGIVISGSNATGFVRVTIADSVVSNNGFAGIEVRSDFAKAQTPVVVTGSQIVNNIDTGISCSARIRRSMSGNRPFPVTGMVGNKEVRATANC